MLKLIIALVLTGALMSGCTTTQKGAATGTAIGAGLGAIIGHQSGHTAEGAVVGAAAGGLTGALVGEQMDTQYCPVCGRRYTSGVQYCPHDGSELKPLQK
ncbi:MAG: glycine zipper domain-containing protein [Candidatus Omnitrophica bacterium]|nr:glycine zipper domain-containing protein [Candidatus Omnitrophota bacterium]